MRFSTLSNMLKIMINVGKIYESNILMHYI